MAAGKKLEVCCVSRYGMAASGWGWKMEGWEAVTAGGQIGSSTETYSEED